MHISDVFNGDAFSTIALTKNINNIPYNPKRIEQMGLFEGDGAGGAGAGIDTQRVAVASIDGVLQLIPATGLATFENYKKPTRKTYAISTCLTCSSTIRSGRMNW